MYKTFYEGMSTTLPLVALVLFVVTFALVVVKTFGFSKKHDYDPVAELPLTDGPEQVEVKS
jgi:cbb3-type cytochrome oxidase subunit 3